ncbi:MAG: hypothetical protein DRN57_00085 [Thermoplasmata archaeon]|nr:MAG: hypothetical protein DRN57_00085 [Thermoplasmata archaeon]
MTNNEPDIIKGRILMLLRSEPRGLTISEVARSIKLNRNSTAKYLDILQENGQVEMKAAGKAKIFSISHRIPIAGLLNFSNDLILVLDENLRIVDANEKFLEFFERKKEMLLEVKLQSTGLPIFTSKESIAKIRNAIKGEESAFDMEIKLIEERHYFQGKLVPTTWGDGKKGATIIMENITESRVAEEKLRESEEKYRTLIENQGEGLVINDEHDRFIFANPVAEELMGVQPGGLIGRSVDEFVPESEKRRIARFNERRRKGYKDTYQINIRRDDGSRKVILLTATPRSDKFGKFIGSFGVFRDITLMKENERKLKTSEERYRALFESSSDSIFILKGKRIVQCNRSSIEMFGSAGKDDLIGTELISLFPDTQDDGTRSDEELDEKLAEARVKGSSNAVCRCLRRDGSKFLSDMRIQKVVTGGETLYQVTIRDISEIVETQRKLQENQNRLNNILLSLYDSFIGIINREMKYEYFWGSPELDLRYGINADDVLGRSIFEFAPADKREEFEHLINGIFDTGIPTRMEVSMDFGNNRFWQLMSLSPYVDENGSIPYVIQYAIDTTEKNRAVEALKEIGEKYRLLEENLSDVIWMADRNMNYTYISSSSVHMTGYDPQELIGTSILGRVESSFLERLKRQEEKIFSDFISGRKVTNRNMKFELPLRIKNGDLMWAEINVTILTDEDGTPVGLTGVTRDISERKKAEAEIAKFSTAFRAAVDSLIITDERGRVSDLNDAAVELLIGNTEKKVFGTEVSRLIRFSPKDGWKRYLKGIENEEKEPLRNAKGEVLRPDGSRIKLEINASPLIHHGNGILGILIVARSVASGSH